MSQCALERAGHLGDGPLPEGPRACAASAGDTGPVEYSAPGETGPVEYASYEPFEAPPQDSVPAQTTSEMPAFTNDERWLAVIDRVVRVHEELSAARRAEHSMAKASAAAALEHTAQTCVLAVEMTALEAALQARESSRACDAREAGGVLEGQPAQVLADMVTSLQAALEESEVERAREAREAREAAEQVRTLAASEVDRAAEALQTQQAEVVALKAALQASEDGRAGDEREWREQVARLLVTGRLAIGPAFDARLIGRARGL